MTSIVAHEAAEPNNGNYKMRLSQNQFRALYTLTWELRTAHEQQLADGLGLSLPQVQRMLRRLRRQGLVHTWRTTSLRLDLAGPLANFERGGEVADFKPLAWQLRKRWQQSPRVSVRVCWASHAATELVGGVGGRLRQPLQLDHDLGVAEIWARRRKQANVTWISEDIFRSWYLRDKHAKVPDALLLNLERTKVLRVLEFGGQYAARRLKNFHRYWASRAPYEIW